VDLVDGPVLAQGSVHMPYTLVGRDEACDVTLTDAEVNPRHAWLQVLGGRLYAVDLGSRTGLTWPDGTTRSGWLDVGTPVRIGPFRLHLREPVADYPTPFPPNYLPLQSDPEVLRKGPRVQLEFRNGKRASDSWTVNRLITLVGRAPECKIHLTADDIVAYHCGLVHTPKGLWVVDLSGRGVVVNGERMRVAPLRDGSELWVGRFLIGVQHPTSGHSPGGYLGYPISRAFLDTVPPLRPVSDDDDDSEVELGAIPEMDPNLGLPSSHIMADAFRDWAAAAEANAPISDPILIAGAGPQPPAPSRSGPLLPHRPAPASEAALAPASEAALAPLLRQLGDIHGQLITQFQEALVLLVKVCGYLRPEQAPALQRELSRIQELNLQLAELQAQVATRALEQVRSAPATVNPAPATPPPAGTAELATAATAELAPVPTPAPATPALHQWIADRIHDLQQERHTRWQSLVGLVSTSTLA
jgi:pSer/pThr/pTyr-binding forkhead associated (FHA) protein